MVDDDTRDHHMCKGRSHTMRSKYALVRFVGEERPFTCASAAVHLTEVDACTCTL